MGGPMLRPEGLTAGMFFPAVMPEGWHPCLLRQALTPMGASDPLAVIPMPFTLTQGRALDICRRPLAVSPASNCRNDMFQ